MLQTRDQLAKFIELGVFHLNCSIGSIRRRQKTTVRATTALPANASIQWNWSYSGSGGNYSNPFYADFLAVPVFTPEPASYAAVLGGLALSRCDADGRGCASIRDSF
jgi:hypothetical protein